MSDSTRHHAPLARRTSRIRRHLLALSAFAAIIWTHGCAEERPAIDRVQPNALDKAFFVGADLQDPSDNPEFWTQATLIDVAYGAAQDGLFTSTYAQPMSRIRWQVTEDYLLGRLSYERIEGTDGHGLGASAYDGDIDGVVVVAFPIEEHFDIAWAYNPTTGEQLNILEENTSDRPWYERQYFRVDFSRNDNTDSYDFDTLSLLGVFGGIEYEALAYYVEDPKDPNAPVFNEEEGYFDITNKAFAKPKSIDLSQFGWGEGSFPACFLDADFSGGSAPSGTCSPVELTIRHSFRRVVDHDYEPMDWDGLRQQSYGAFTVERSGYARNYGMSDARWRRFIARYPIWERSHYYADPAAMTGAIECFTPETTPFGADPHRDTDQDGTEDECAAAGAGSRCDEFRQRCTLPFQERTPVVIPWYYTSGSNETFYDATDRATHEWDVAMRVAIRTAQYAECMRVEGQDCETRFPVYHGQEDDNVDAIALAREVDDCRRGLAYTDEPSCGALADELATARGYSAGVADIAKMPEVVVQCHSPVLASDHPACGPEGRVVRPGDLRYHQLNVLTAPQTPSPWGIYTDAEDPLTGETVSASINVWSHVNDLWSQSVVDTLRYIAGELRTEDITDGKYVRNWDQAAQAVAGGGGARTFTREELDRRMRAFDEMAHEMAHESGSDTPRGDARAPGADQAGGPADARAEAAHLQIPEEVLAQVRQLKSELQGVRASLDAASTNQPIYAARRAAAAGTAFEAELMTKAVQELHGIAGMPMTDALMDVASPLRGGNPTFQHQLMQLKENALAERGACMLGEAPAPLSIAGLGGVLQDKFGAFNPTDSPDVQQARAERMRRYIADKAQYAVIIHEMGHSIGLRHNFISSSDAWGYRPQYWQLRTRNGAVVKPCEDLAEDGATCVVPRYFDPVTQEETDNLIWAWQHSSVMDYAGEPVQDMLGLGAYDFAAAKMFYGDTVAVHADESYAVGTGRAQGMLAKMDNFGGILGLQPSVAGTDIHYSQLNTFYELISDCHTVDPALFKPARWDEELHGTWHPVLDGLIVRVDGEYSRCRQQKVDYVPWSSLRMPTDAETAGYYDASVSVDLQGRVRVPYGFATDSWADLGNVSVYRHDNGADIYEIFDFLITKQEIDHIFDNYRRGRQGFSVKSAANRTLHRYNTKLRDGAKGLGLFRNIYADFALARGYDGDAFWYAIAPLFFKEQILASGMVFDHFAHMLARPQAGAHQWGDDGVLRSSDDTYADGPTAVVVPNGATGYYGDVGFGGRPVNNDLSNDHGEYNSSITVNAGSYYDKINSAMLFTESVDNYISSSRDDFVDARYRATSLADLFPEGYRRLLSNALTGDDSIKGPRVATNAQGKPILDEQGYPAWPIGWTSWWGPSPSVCFPADGTTICESYGGTGIGPDELGGATVSTSAPLDPQIGWEQQKFLIAWTLMYLPENQQQRWMDMLRIWELGKDADPGFTNRIELHNPSGKVYIAKTSGSEVIFGQRVHKSIAARVLQYANDLLVQAYEVTDGPDLDHDGSPDWYIPYVDPSTGRVHVRYDPSIDGIDEESYIYDNGLPGCDADATYACTCSSNRACIALERYMEVPFFLRQALDAYQLVSPSPKGAF